MSLWVILAIGGAFAQNLRSALQKRLTDSLSVSGAAFTRFAYAWPFAFLYVLILDVDLQANRVFVLYTLAGSLAQILATVSLLAAFRRRNFAVSTALSKTETLQTVGLGIVLLGESVTRAAFAGMAVSLLGLWFLSVGATRATDVAARRANWVGTGYGLLAGFGLAGSAVCYRAAALSLPMLPTAAQAATTLVTALLIQVVVFGVYLGVRSPTVLRAVGQSWRGGLAVGLAGFIASACWFTAMALVNAAYVRAVGQIELVFSLLISLLWFGERPLMREWLGVGLLSFGIVLVLLGWPN